MIQRIGELNRGLMWVICGIEIRTGEPHQITEAVDWAASIRS